MVFLGVVAAAEWLDVRACERLSAVSEGDDVVYVGGEVGAVGDRAPWLVAEHGASESPPLAGVVDAATGPVLGGGVEGPVQKVGTGGHLPWVGPEVGASPLHPGVVQTVGGRVGIGRGVGVEGGARGEQA
jgi:hypothetical protein